jgi:hypothetical protein
MRGTDVNVTEIDNKVEDLLDSSFDFSLSEAFDVLRQEGLAQTWPRMRNLDKIKQLAKFGFKSKNDIINETIRAELFAEQLNPARMPPERGYLNQDPWKLRIELMDRNIRTAYPGIVNVNYAKQDIADFLRSDAAKQLSGRGRWNQYFWFKSSKPKPDWKPVRARGPLSGRVSIRFEENAVSRLAEECTRLPTLKLNFRREDGERKNVHDLVGDFNPSATDAISVERSGADVGLVGDPGIPEIFTDAYRTYFFFYPRALKRQFTYCEATDSIVHNTIPSTDTAEVLGRRAPTRGELANKKLICRSIHRRVGT